MTIVEKGNVVLEIKDSEVERYLDLGYNVTDGKGNIIKESIPTDLGSLRKAYMEHTEEIKALKAKIEQLQNPVQQVEDKPVKRTAKSSK